MLSAGLVGMVGRVLRSASRDTLALDLLSTASAAAYSLRKLRTAYSGNAIRVRRSSDNAEQDIGFLLYVPEIEPRLDQEALLRHAGENRIIQSEDLSNAAWGKSAGSSLVAAGTHNGSPAWLFTEAASDVRHRVNSTAFTRPAGSAFVARVRVKSNGRQFIQILFNAGISNLSQNFDLENLTFGGSAGLSPTITDVGDGWRELTLFYPAAALGNGSFFIAGASSLAMARDLAYLGDGTSGFFIAQPQVTFGDVAKGYAATDAAALEGNGFVTTWYDQSGNARDAVQATAASQPRIVNAGVVETIGERPALDFDGVDDHLSLPATITPTPGIFWSAVIRTMRDDGTRDGGIVTITSVNNQNSHFGGNTGQPRDWFDHLAASTRPQITANPYPSGVNHVVTLRHTGSNLVGRVDGVQVGSPAVAFSNSPTSRFIGRGPSGAVGVGSFSEKRIAEIVIGNAPENEVETLERNQGAFYGITVA